MFQAVPCGCYDIDPLNPSWKQCRQSCNKLVGYYNVLEAVTGIYPDNSAYLKLANHSEILQIQSRLRQSMYQKDVCNL